MTDSKYPPAPWSAAVTSAEGVADLLAKASLENIDAAAYGGDDVDRASLAPEHAPVVKLPLDSSCVGCPNALDRNSESVFDPPPEVFESLLGFPTAAPQRPPLVPCAWAGLDWSGSPCEFRRPGLDVLARVVDPSRLSEGLFVNRILPDCTCTIALHAAADHDGANGMRLDDLRQEAELTRRRNLPGPVKATRVHEKCPSGLPPWPHVPVYLLKARLLGLEHRPNITPDPGVVRRHKAAKAPQPRTPQDLFAAFGIDKSTN